MLVSGGLENGERIVVTQLSKSGPVKGVKVQIEEKAEKPKSGEEPGKETAGAD